MSNPYGTTPSPNDDERLCLIKIVDLLAGGGGGGGGGVMPAGVGGVMQGAADPPVAPPTDINRSWIYFVEGTGTIYNWNKTTHVWS